MLKKIWMGTQIACGIVGLATCVYALYWYNKMMKSMQSEF